MKQKYVPILVVAILSVSLMPGFASGQGGHESWQSINMTGVEDSYLVIGMQGVPDSRLIIESTTNMPAAMISTHPIAIRNPLLALITCPPVSPAVSSGGAQNPFYQ